MDVNLICSNVPIDKGYGNLYHVVGGYLNFIEKVRGFRRIRRYFAYLRYIAIT